MARSRAVPVDSSKIGIPKPWWWLFLLGRGVCNQIIYWFYIQLSLIWYPLHKRNSIYKNVLQEKDPRNPSTEDLWILTSLRSILEHVSNVGCIVHSQADANQHVDPEGILMYLRTIQIVRYFVMRFDNFYRYIVCEHWKKSMPFVSWTYKITNDFTTAHQNPLKKKYLWCWMWWNTTKNNERPRHVETPLIVTSQKYI